MNSLSPRAGKLSIKDISALSIMGALIFAAKIALAALPNISLNALLIILTAVFFGWKALYAVSVYIMLEGLVFGFGPWWLCYWYLWPTLAAIAVLMRKNSSALIWAVAAAAFGLCFGALCSIPYLFIGGWAMALSYWVSGIPFDLMHCGGNFVTTLVLYKPLYRAMNAILNKPSAPAETKT